MTAPQLHSELYGAYSMSGSSPPNAWDLIFWCREGTKHPVSMYRRLIPDYAALEGEEKMFAEDRVDLLFTPSELTVLLQYLTRFDTFGDRHIVIRAEAPSLIQLHLEMERKCQGSFNLQAYGGWHAPFLVSGVELMCTHRAFLN